MLVEVVMGRIDTPQPITNLLAPVLRQGEYAGYINGVLNLAQLHDYLESSAGHSAMLYTLLDRTGNIILSNRKEQQVMTPLLRGQGSMNRLSEGVSQWLPALPPNVPTADRWMSSFYVSETFIGDLAEWTLVLEQPVAPYQKIIYAHFTEALKLLLLILAGVLALAEFMSRRSHATLDALSRLTRDLPEKLAKQGATIDWPETAVMETESLIANFRKMSDTLARRLGDIHEINASLEKRVNARTVELRESEHKLAEILENVDAYIFLKDAQGRYVFANRAVCNLFGVSMEEIIGQTDDKFFDAVASAQLRLNDRKVLVEGLTLRTEETDFNLKNGRSATYQSVKIPLRDSAGKIYALCGMSTDITERKLMEDQIRQLAFYDPLTKLPNRRLLQDRLTQTMAANKRSGCYGALMFLDLDNFKPLNDTYGHDVGDQLLIEAANRLKSCVREMDTVARFGGDEFVVMLSELKADKAASMVQAEIVAEKIRNILSDPYRLTMTHPGKGDIPIEHGCTASIGVVLFMNHETSQDDIIEAADKAMYQAKEAGRNTVRFLDLHA